jgi:hypothetical protein
MYLFHINFIKKGILIFKIKALEGYLLYRALVVVFDTGDNRHFPLYIFGYGIPTVLTTITFIVALLVSDSNFDPEKIVGPVIYLKEIFYLDICVASFKFNNFLILLFLFSTFVFSIILMLVLWNYCI